MLKQSEQVKQKLCYKKYFFVAAISHFLQATVFKSETFLSITFPQLFQKSNMFGHWKWGKKTVKWIEKHQYQKNPAQ